MDTKAGINVYIFGPPSEVSMRWLPFVDAAFRLEIWSTFWSLPQIILIIDGRSHLPIPVYMNLKPGADAYDPMVIHATIAFAFLNHFFK